MSTPVVVNEEEFDLVVEVIENEEGSTVEEDAIIDPDGNIAVEIEGSSITEKGQGLLEWMALSGTVAFIVLLFFSVFGSAFATAFNTYITDVLPW